MTVPGIGPLIASAMVAAIANGAAFAKGRDFAAWLGLVPKQMSTGDRTILGHISKRVRTRGSPSSSASPKSFAPILDVVCPQALGTMRRRCDCLRIVGVDEERGWSNKRCPCRLTLAGRSLPPTPRYTVSSV